MAKNVAIGIQSFAELREKDYFYVDKTDFIDLNNLKEKGSDWLEGNFP